MSQHASGKADRTRQPSGWLYVEPDAVPPHWRDRAIHVCLIPLFPGEAEQVLDGDQVIPEIDRDDKRLVKLLGRGLSVDAIAEELSITPRTVRRRLVALRHQWDVGSNAELAAFLASRGFRS